MTNIFGSIEGLAFLLQQAPRIGPSALRSILAKIADEQISASDFYKADDKTLTEVFKVPADALDAVRLPTPSTLDSWDELMRRGVRIHVFGFSGYPERFYRSLANTSPPILYSMGNTDLFRLTSVGFCGSRKASLKGIDVATNCAKLLSQESINVVSGYAAGVDMATHAGAVDSGGTTTIVLPTGILEFHLKLQVLGFEEHLTRVLAVSEFPPRLPWKAYNAMARNRTICGLSDVMVVVESGNDGGTFEAGKTALSLGMPLFCVEYADPGNEAAGNAYFLSHGATALRRFRDGQPNLTKLVAEATNANLRGSLLNKNSDQLGLAF